MRKKIVGVFIVFLFIGAILVPTISSSEIIKTCRLGRTFYVGGSGPGNYTRIQDAIDDASDGDTVFVYSGIYYENIIINKTISLEGENRDKPVVDGNKHNDVVTISSDYVKIEGFTIQRSAYVHSGILVYESYHVTISNNIIVDNSWGITLHNSHFNNILGNVIKENQFIGISSSYFSANNNIILDNEVINNGKGSIGIAFAHSNGNEIINNIISGNLEGINFLDMGGNKIIDNIISENRLHGIFLEDSRDNTIMNNDFLNNYVDASFITDSIRHNNFYLRNYWNESLTIPKIIYGVIEIGHFFKISHIWVNFDFWPRAQPKDS